MNCTNPLDDHRMLQTRRHFFGKMAKGMGAMALGSLFQNDALGMPQMSQGLTNFAPKAKRVIYMFQSGAPSPQDLFDPKPYLRKHNGEELADHIEMTRRVTGMTANQSSFPIAGSHYDFQRYGQCGMEISELLPHTGSIADDICLVRSMWTEAINHDPAVTFFQTGSQIAGRPSIGSWLSYGLGTDNKDLPNFVAMVSRGTGRPNCQPLYDRLWGSGFLPTQHAGVKFMSIGDPVLYLKDPSGMSKKARREMLDRLGELNEQKLDDFADPEIYSRIQAYEMAYRMQTSVPELSDISDEPDHVLEMYGPDVHKRGSYAYNCLMARRLAERGVQFTQLFHMGWDQHFNLPTQLPGQCRDTDQASAALVKDLKQRGMLDDTLIVWGGEFGRTSYSQGKMSKDSYGRDHHPGCFPIWMAGAGIKPGNVFGQTDKLCYNIVDQDGNPLIPDKHHNYTKDAVHVHDLHATMMHLMGVDHERLTFKYQGRNFRLTDVHGHVVKGVLS